MWFVNINTCCFLLFLLYNTIIVGEFMLITEIKSLNNLRDLFTGQVKSRDFMGVVGISKTVAKTETFKSFIKTYPLSKYF